MKNDHRQNNFTEQLPTEPGWYWIKNPKAGTRQTSQEWTVIFIKRLEADLLHLKAGELIVGENTLEAFARANRLTAFIKVEEPGNETPIDMVLYCPACGYQHIDQPQPEKDWVNPPHRTHECQFCNHRFRPADVPTNGVEKIKTRGQSDSPVMPKANGFSAEPVSDTISEREKGGADDR